MPIEHPNKPWAYAHICNDFQNKTEGFVFRSGGYKISALDVERILLSHPQVSDIAVLGVEDPVYGQRVGAVIVTKQGSEINLAQVLKTL